MATTKRQSKTINLTQFCCGTGSAKHPHREELDCAIRVFDGRSSLQHELCRALLKRSIALDGSGKADAAQADFMESNKLYLELHPSANKAETVTEEKVDLAVAFWSR